MASTYGQYYLELLILFKLANLFTKERSHSCEKHAEDFILQSHVWNFKNTVL